MRLLETLQSRLQYKIILPFLLLTLLVALAGAAVALLIITGSAQERLDNQLAQTARAAADAVVMQESANLQFLREAVFAGPNVAANAPAVADALAAGDTAGLERALDPFYRVGVQRAGVRLDRLIAFDSTGRSLLDWERPEGQPAAGRVRHEPRDLRALWFVPRTLGHQQDALGDKYAGLVDLGGERYLFTVAPVMQNQRVVGGMVIATRLPSLLGTLQSRSLAAIVTVYDAADGAAFASTAGADLAPLRLPPTLAARVRASDAAARQGIFDAREVNGRGYQFAYAPLRVRGATIGILSVALANDYVIAQWMDARAPLLGLTILLMLMIIGLGVAVARQITRPLQELVATAQAVTAGDLERRSRVSARDEVGLLADSFNNMTGHLLELVRAVRAEASQRAAIVESIADGVVVCDPAGAVLVTNRALRELLGLAPEAPAPPRFDAIPLTPLHEAALSFGHERAPALYRLGQRVVRVASAPVMDGGTRLGEVYVLQDMTREVEVDRAKTNFIATISHELRTPLTVMSGSSDLLLRGYAGQLTDEQRMLLEAMRKHTQHMTNLLNNVILLAGLDTGAIEFHTAPVALECVLEDVLWTHRPACAAKGLALHVDLAHGLPEIVADSQQLRNALHQLLDNARRYTQAGSVTIRAYAEADQVRIDICDTGRGIEPELEAQLFARFSRGAEGINSAERGIGLGLAIAHELVRRQGGALWLERTSSEGSVFSLTLPGAHANHDYTDTTLASAA